MKLKKSRSKSLRFVSKAGKRFLEDYFLVEDEVYIIKFFQKKQPLWPVSKQKPMQIWYLIWWFTSLLVSQSLWFSWPNPVIMVSTWYRFPNIFQFQISSLLFPEIHVWLPNCVSAFFFFLVQKIWPLCQK